ncbi:MAG: FAD-dependent oxidoreductase [Deltaproteobacteria bacterium]|nr:FAD-dependent oxidoreductase [Deltaproteobacteria bacterium]
MTRRHVVVIGGSATGMAAALALARSGERVTVLERDAIPVCASAVEAFESWQRPGTPQARHSHAFLARLHNSVRDRAPDFYQALLAAGAAPLRLAEIVGDTQAALLPADEDLTLLACRRITFDWVLRRHLAASTDVVYRDRVMVEGLEASPDASTGLPQVRGVRARAAESGAERIAADLVVDASGRRTRLREWLAAIGAAPLESEVQPCGIFYCTRFYRLHEGVEPPPIDGPIGADLGYMKYAIFPGDSRIFSITLAAAPEDRELRRVVRERVFQAAAAAIPATRSWVDPAVSAPITRVHGFGDLNDTLRLFVRDDAPLALGLFPVGDALVHANPLSGRGCTLGWLSAWMLADAWARHPGDPLGFARALHAEIARELVPWYEDMRDQDHAAIRAAGLARAGIDPLTFERPDGSVDPGAYLRSLIRDGLVPALREDAVVLRAFLRVFNMLDSPKSLLGSPDVLQRIVAVWQRRHQREPFRLGPDRDEMATRLRAA